MNIHHKILWLLLLFPFLNQAGIAQTITGRGASVSFTTYEAENASTNASKLGYGTTYRTPQSEASGRNAVKLQNTNDYVEFTLAHPANGLVFRYSIPDGTNGGGADATLGFYIDNQKQNDLQLTSKYAWIYGGYPYDNAPSNGNPHLFYDDVSVLLSQTYPAGTKIKLQKNAGNAAAYYTIDLMEAEEVPSLIQQPANSISITDHGAQANNSGKDNTQALRSAIAAAVSAGKEVWIPAGTFYFTQSSAVAISNNNVVIRGAGMWHTTLTGGSAKFMIKASNVKLRDFSIRGTTTRRDNDGNATAIESDYHTQNMQGTTISKVWIEHFSVGIWIHNTNGLHVENCRVRNVYADGIHLRRGTANSIVEHNHVRNTGDDGIAMWSTEIANANNKIRFNTVGLPSLASGIAVYGGSNNEITDNIIHDIVFAGGGINISMQHSPVAFSGTTTAARNTLLRTGSTGDWNVQRGGIWIHAAEPMPGQILLANNEIYNSTHQGVSFSDSKRINEVKMENNTINGAGNWGVYIGNDCEGRLYTYQNTFSNCASANIRNDSQNGRFTITEQGGGTNPNPVMVNVRFKAPNTWLQVFAYVWGKQEVAGGWPGQTLSNKDSEGFYTFSFDKTGYSNADEMNIIFNNNSGGEQTVSIATLTDGCWALGTLDSTDQYGQKHYNVNGVDCGTTAIEEEKKEVEIDRVAYYNAAGLLFTSLDELPKGIYFKITIYKDGTRENKSICKY